MRSTTNFKPGDVLLIPFPFTDLTAQKKRPCLVVSTSLFNDSHPDIIAAAITSQIPEKISSWEYLLTEKERLSCGLPKPSIVKLGKIVTLDQRLVRKTLGKLPASSTKRLLTQLKKLFSN